MMGIRRKILLECARSGLCLFIALASFAGFASEDGGKIYSEYCSVCHGDNGDGKSRARQGLNPPPRDFTTPESAVEMTLQGMIHVVAEGKPGTAMTAWNKRLNDEQIRAVVDFIRNNFMMSATTDEFATGRRLYAEYCSVCHGDKGEGSVWAMQGLDPSPINFASAKAKQELNRERMIFSATYGRPETAMSAWGKRLSEAEIASVVDYVRVAFMGDPDRQRPAISGSGKAQSLPPTANISPDFPVGLIGSPKRGAGLYLQNCIDCHGEGGDGQGKRAYFVFPKPRNFHQPSIKPKFTRGYLYNAIAKGSLRTEMPAWEKVLSAQQIADIAEYVRLVFIEWGCTAACTSSREFLQLPDPE